MKKKLALLLAGILTLGSFAGCGGDSGNGNEEPKSSVNADGELEGDITFWHSFTQGGRLDTIQAAADKFMEENPKVNIKIETFSWNDFYTKWTTGLASGNVPDMSTALVGHVTEMINSDALVPLNDLIDDIGRDKFSENAINEGTVDGNNYSIPLYSHAMVMWVRKDLLEQNGLEVPKTWDELYETAKKLTKDGVYPSRAVPMIFRQQTS